MSIIDKLKAFMDNNPARLKFGLNEIQEVSYGTTRVAFEIYSGPMSGCILKFARDGKMRSINKAEVATWKMAEKKGKTEYFCPIVDHDAESYNWIIMERANMNVSITERREFRKEVEEEFPDQFIDFASCNIGRHEGDIKLVDYDWA